MVNPWLVLAILRLSALKHMGSEGFTQALLVLAWVLTDTI